MLVDVSKTKQSHRKRKTRNSKDTNMKVEPESTNNKEQLLNKVIHMMTDVVIDGGALLH